MKKIMVAAALLLALSGGREGLAVEVAGLQVPEKTVVGGEELLLNGAGVRKKLFVKVYVGALYLAEKKTDGGEVLEVPGPKRVSMHILHDKVGVTSIVKAWRKGFENNLSRAEMTSLSDESAAFMKLFRTVRAGEYYDLDYVPGQGTVVRLNGELVGRVPGERFYRALLMVWLGPRPADKGLKRSLLGG